MLKWYGAGGLIWDYLLLVRDIKLDLSIVIARPSSASALGKFFLASDAARVSDAGLSSLGPTCLALGTMTMSYGRYWSYSVEEVAAGTVGRCQLRVGEWSCRSSQAGARPGIGFFNRIHPSPPTVRSREGSPKAVVAGGSWLCPLLEAVGG